MTRLTRYAAAPGAAHAWHRRLAMFVWYNLTRPSRDLHRIFPGRFDRAFARIVADKALTAVPTRAGLAFYDQQLVIDVDPARLTHKLSDYVSDGGAPRWIGQWFLDGGDWSAALEPIEQSLVFEEMRELIAADLDYRATRAYRKAKKAIQEGRPAAIGVRTFADLDEVRRYFQYCVILIRRVKKYGVIRRKDLPADIIAALPPGRADWMDQRERDIGVAIDADGALVRHLSGKHRLAAARGLGLKTVPVEVRMVHVDWLKRQVDRTGLAPHLALIEGLKTL